MRNGLAAMAVMLLLGGCSVAGPHDPPFMQRLNAAPRYKLSDTDMQLVERYISSRLKDPDKADFGKMVASLTGDGDILVCGSYTIKNWRGGAVGSPRPFYATLEAGQVKEMQTADDFQSISLGVSLAACPDN